MRSWVVLVVVWVEGGFGDGIMWGWWAGMDDGRDAA